MYRSCEDVITYTLNNCSKTLSGITAYFYDLQPVLIIRLVTSLGEQGGRRVLPLPVVEIEVNEAGGGVPSHHDITWF